MKRIATTTKRNVVLLTEPDAEFVSFVDHGANQRPLKVTKADAPLSVRSIKPNKQTKAMPKSTTKTKAKKGAAKKPVTSQKKSVKVTRTPNKKGDDKNAPNTGVDVHRITFSKKEFTTRAEVENYLDQNGYRDYEVKEERSQWVMPGRDITDFRKDSVEEMEGEDEGVSIFAGKLTKDAATEGNSKSKPKPEKLPKKKPTNSPVAKSKAKKADDEDEDESDEDDSDDEDEDEDDSDDAEDGDEEDSDDSDDSEDDTDEDDDTDEGDDDDSDDEDESDDEEEDSDDDDSDDDDSDDSEDDEDADDEDDSEESDDDEDESEDDESDEEDDSEDDDDEEDRPAKSKKKPAPKSKAKKGEDDEEDDSDDDEDEETASAFKGRKGRPGKVHKMKKGKVPSKSPDKVKKSATLRSIVKKLDYYGTQSSRSTSVTGVMKDGEGDLPPGVDEVFFATRIALRNSFRKEGSARTEAIDALGAEFSKVVKRVAAAFDAVEKADAKGKKHPLKKWIRQFVAEDEAMLTRTEKFLVSKKAALAADDNTDEDEDNDESPGASRAPTKEKKLAAIDIRKAVESGLGQVTKTFKKALAAFEGRVTALESQRQRKQALTDADEDDEGDDDGRERLSKDDEEEDAEFDALMRENKTGVRVTRSKAKAKR